MILNTFLFCWQLFYFHTIDWQPPIVDKRSLPVVSWTSLNIQKCMKQLQKQGGFGTAKVCSVINK